MLFAVVQGSTNLEAIQIIKKLGGNLSDSYLEEGNEFTKFYCTVTKLFLQASCWKRKLESINQREWRMHVF